jgi:hypothetical protein
MPEPANLTERQRKWFASVREGLQSATGRSVEEWAILAKACPETAPRKRLAWMKAEYGLGQNHAALIMRAAFPPEVSWSNPEALSGALWSDPEQRAILDALTAHIVTLPEVIVTQRRGFTAFSRKVQFAAARPAQGAARLGLALDPSVDPALSPAGRESWSERLKSVISLNGPEAIDPGVQRVIEMAWARS